MLFSEYLDTIEGTEDEARLFEQIDTFKDEIAQGANIPVVGKIVAAILALREFNSVAEFRQSDHYQHVAGWYCTIDLDKGIFSLQPGPKFWKKVSIVCGIVSAGLLALWVWRKCCKCCNKA